MNIRFRGTNSNTIRDLEAIQPLSRKSSYAALLCLAMRKLGRTAIASRRCMITGARRLIGACNAAGSGNCVTAPIRFHYGGTAAHNRSPDKLQLAGLERHGARTLRHP